MRFSTKVALAIGCVAGITSLLFCLVVAYSGFNRETAAFVKHGETQLKMTASTLFEIEKRSDLVADLALKNWREQEKLQGLLSNEALTEFKDHLHVSNMFAFDENGRFLRSTNGPSDRSLFDYCDEYRNILRAEGVFEHTPILWSDEGIAPGPYKYSMTSNHDRTRILEVSISADFVGSALSNALASDASFRSLTLRSPTGSLLGHVGHGGAVPKTLPVNALSSSLSEPTWRGGTMALTRAVKVSSGTCCECVVKGLATVEQDYAYYLTAVFDTTQLDETRNSLVLRLAQLSLLLGIAASASGWLISKKLVGGLEVISQSLALTREDNDLSRRICMPGSDEISALAGHIDAMTAALEKSVDSKMEMEKVKGMASAASQMAHDIRSPLAALDMLSSALVNIPEDERTILRSAVARMRDIANGVLSRRRSSETFAHLAGRAPQPTRPQMLVSTLGTLVSEKRLEYSNRLNIQLEQDFTSGSYGLFVSAESSDLKRLFSNLVNNAVEALPEGGGIIRITVKRSGHFAEIAVKDNGRGMPEEVLNQLGHRPVTHGKSNGNGLGLTHAHQCVEAWGGKLNVHSILGQGTQVILHVPVIDAPEWFIPQLDLHLATTVVILDDDPAIHATWEKILGDYPVPLKHFSGLDEFKTWASGKREGILVLSDYELIGESTTGLEAVLELGLERCSILVTSHFEDEAIQDLCRDKKMRMLPKGLVPMVPVVFHASETSSRFAV